jgi:hypothetical protein
MREQLFPRRCEEAVDVAFLDLLVIELALNGVQLSRAVRLCHQVNAGVFL